MDSRTFDALYREYRKENLDTQRKSSSSILISACRPNLELDPLLWLPMTSSERSRSLRWRLGWLPGGIPKPCIYYPHNMFTRNHAIHCLHMHRRLQMPFTVVDPLSFLLNKLPVKRTKRPSTSALINFSPWSIRWPAICQILYELDYLHHGKIPPETSPLGHKLLNWFRKQ